MSGTASARVSIGIGIGTSFGHHHHYSHGWHGGVYMGPSYWYDPWYDPYWDPYPVVVVPPPVVHERVIIPEARPTPPAPPAPPVAKVDPLSEKQQQTRNEALKVLKIGDIESRIQAVDDLEPFAREDRVRTALQDRLADDRNPEVRKVVAELFSRLKDPKTLPALKRAYAEDEDRDVRQAAYKGIAMMEGYEGL